MVGIAGMVLTQRLGLKDGDLRGGILPGGPTTVCCRDNFANTAHCAAIDMTHTECPGESRGQEYFTADQCSALCVPIVNGCPTGICRASCSPQGVYPGGMCLHGLCCNMPKGAVTTPTPPPHATPPPPPSPTKCDQKKNCMQTCDNKCVYTCIPGYGCGKFKKCTARACSFNPPDTEFGKCISYPPGYSRC